MHGPNENLVPSQNFPTLRCNIMKNWPQGSLFHLFCYSLYHHVKDSNRRYRCGGARADSNRKPAKQARSDKAVTRYIYLLKLVLLDFLSSNSNFVTFSVYFDLEPSVMFYFMKDEEPVGSGGTTAAPSSIGVEDFSPIPAYGRLTGGILPIVNY
jgi:hypothetical protein